MPSITVEIFRDYVTPEVEIDTVLKGMDILKGITNAIEVVNDMRMIRLNGVDTDFIDSNHDFNWPDFSADINIFATNRPLATNGVLDEQVYGATAQRLGVALIPIKPTATRVALVTSTEGKSSSLAVAHEVGHLFDLKRSGETNDQNGHCLDEHCVMFPMAATTEVISTEPTATSRRWLKLGRTTMKDVYSHESSIQEFCLECANQPGQTAFFWQRAKAGHHVLSQFLPRSVQ